MNIISKPSPNFTTGRKTYKPEAIVIHIMQGSLCGTDSWFSNRQAEVSAHYGVSKTGEVHQFVDEKNTAWHAGVVTTPSWSLIRKAAGNYYINPNYYTVGIEHEGTVDTDWADAMYESTSTLIAEISKRWNIPIDRNHVIGHHEIYAVKACPGNKVDFNKLIAMAIAKTAQPQPFIPKRAFAAENATATVLLNIRSAPNTTQKPIRVIEPGTILSYVGVTPIGENLQGNATWLLTSDGHWFWSGGVK
jgi:N-acetyl-anhydromuramyl-L-alanine amidase AmpD